MEKMIVVPGVITIKASDFIKIEKGYLGGMYLYYIERGWLYNSERWVEIPYDKIEFVEESLRRGSLNT